MASPLYVPTGAPVQGAKGASLSMRNEFIAIETAIDVLNAIPFPVTFADLNTAASRYVVIPWAGSITTCYVVNSVANTTTKTVITLEIGGTLVTMTALEVGATDAVGTVNSQSPSALNTFSAGAAIEVITDGGGAPVMPGEVTLLIARTS